MMGVVEWAIGLVLAAMTLRDVFDTVVVPGRSRGFLKIARRVVFGVLKVRHRTRGGAIGLAFAPSMLLAGFVIWILLLVLAFGLIIHALRDAFAPHLQGLGEAMYVAGGAMTTMGFGTTQPSGWARVVTVGASFCGLAVMTMAVTYLLQVQTNIAVRDTTVLKIGTTAGQPPSALAWLEYYASFDGREELGRILQEGRDWCAAVLQSHASRPSLIYFRSAGTGAGWPASLGTFLDLALIVEVLLEQQRGCAAAELLRREADRVAADLTELLGLPAEPVATSAEDVHQLSSRLSAAGYRVRPDADVGRFIALRGQTVGHIHALSKHLGTPPAPLLPNEDSSGS